ncbi:MAG: glutamine synthetase, partial [Proteobacteria bacterium]|nr:glutamine synthetase [Pseudomonadota bacterium]
MSGGAEPLVAVVTTDLAAVTRGRLVTASRFERIAQAGVGWLQANIALTPFNGIANPNPWGSRGDLRLVPDLAARFRATGLSEASAFDMVMGDIVELGGTPWSACPRNLLRTAMDELKSGFGLDLAAAFEQEFTLQGLAQPAPHSLSLAAVRRVDPFGPMLMAALGEAGVDPEVFIAEFGADQFEITYGPAPGLAAADRAIAVRELTREVARVCGARASFNPKPAPDAVGSGVHVHFSLQDADGRPAGFDPAG